MRRNPSSPCPPRAWARDAPCLFLPDAGLSLRLPGLRRVPDRLPGQGALEMVPFETQRKRRPNFDNYAMNEKLLKKDIISDKSVKTAQFAKPYFQFSAACAAAETTYIKLVTQLFGSRMYVANASGAPPPTAVPCP